MLEYGCRELTRRELTLKENRCFQRNAVPTDKRVPPVIQTIVQYTVFKQESPKSERGSQQRHTKLLSRRSVKETTRASQQQAQSSRALRTEKQQTVVREGNSWKEADLLQIRHAQKPEKERAKRHISFRMERNGKMTLFVGHQCSRATRTWRRTNSESCQLWIDSVLCARRFDS